MKVAIVHYWFVSQRGGEKVVEELCNIFHHADYIPEFEKDTRKIFSLHKNFS